MTLESVRLKAIELLLLGLKKITLKLLYYQAKYSAEEVVEEVIQKQRFDMRGIKERMQNVMLHDQDIIDRRWAECQKCEFLQTKEKLGKTYSTCSECGCYMKVGDQFIKIRVATASCPLPDKKWDVEYKFLEGKAVNGSQPTVK